MELFDKRFVYIEWDDVLEGKKVFIADTLPELRRFVERGYAVWIVKKHHGDYPFVTEDSVVWHAMAYYDPLYEYKLAYNKGKKVEVYGFVGISRAWIEVTDDWKWDENYEYRILEPEEPKMKRRMTNRELAQWVAQGNGQAKDINSNTITSRGLMYDDGDDNKPCPDYLVIRGWDETEWSEPIIEE